MSVRKAFLDLDLDYDGLVTPEDIVRNFGQDNKKLDFNDLKMLIKTKDSKRRGLLNYTDFSKWMGNTIEPSEGFFFRHDSIKNPQYEMNLERVLKKSNPEQKKAVL